MYFFVSRTEVKKQQGDNTTSYEIIWPQENNVDLPRVMSVHLVHHLPRLVGWERKTIASHRQTHRHYVNLYIDIINSMTK